MNLRSKRILTGSNKKHFDCKYRTLLTKEGKFVAMGSIESVEMPVENIDETVSALAGDYDGWFEIITNGGKTYQVSTLQNMLQAGRSTKYEILKSYDEKRRVVMAERYQIFEEWATIREYG